MALARRLLTRALRPVSLAACGTVCAVRGAPIRRPTDITVMALSFANRVGIAAGFDCAGRLGRRLGRLGFGHVEVGTLTLAGQPGRSVTLAEVRCRLVRSEVREQPGDRATLLGAVVAAADGISADAAAAEIGTCLRSLAPHVDYFTLSLCGPGGRPRWPLEHAQAVLHGLAVWIERETQTVGWRHPVAVKLPSSPDLMALAHSAAASGIVAIVAEHASPEQIGRLAGLRPVIAVGCVRSAADVDARLAAGAVLVQVCRPLFTTGPLAARLCRR